MPRHLWTVVAQRAIVDGATNNTSLVDILEQLNLPPLPPHQDRKKIQAVPLRFSVVTFWRRKDPRLPERTNMRIDFRSPSGKKLMSVESVLDMRKHMRVRVINGVNRFPLDGNGTYSVQVRVQSGRHWRLVDTQYVEVFTVSPPKRVLASGKPVRVPHFH